jgi:hypothetical protein
LHVTVSLNGIARLGLLDQGFRLAALYPLQEELLAPRRNFFFPGRYLWLKHERMTAGRASLFKAGEPVRQLACPGACLDQLSAPELPLDGGCKRVFQAAELSEGGFQSPLALFFLEVPDAQ